MGRISFGLIGPGGIGKALMTQIAEQSSNLKSQYNIHLALVAIANSKRMILDPSQASSLTATSVTEALASPPSLPLHLDSFSQAVRNAAAAQKAAPVIIDASASPDIASHYVSWLSSGIHIVTPNKQFFAGPLTDYHVAQRLVRQGRALLFHEATVGAGLPTLSTLKSLMATGDSIHCVQGILSGTLSYLFNSYKAGDSWARLVHQAKALGYTEPDPRDDLSGMDVARKVVILARSCGLDVALSDIRVESLVPPSLTDCSVDEYLTRLGAFDADMETRAVEASRRNCVLRYVGIVNVKEARESGRHGDGCHVALREFPSNHAFAQMEGSDNIFEFSTTRYQKNKLVIRGPGAGADVTAAGVLSDLIQVAIHQGGCYNL